MSLKNLETVGPYNYYFNVKDQMQRHIYDRSVACFRKGDAARDALSTVDELDEYRKKMRELFIQGIGGLPDSSTPLNPRICGVIGEKGFKIEKVIFESRPGVFVTANLYLPDGITQPSPAVLFVCGHHGMAKHQEEYQRVCRHFVKAGFIVLAQDPVGQGERFSYWEREAGCPTVGFCCPEHDYVGGQCLALGDSLARYFVHDAMRGIDYLCTRHEVDPTRIAVTGNSGGGTQTSLVMMCDPRIAAAVPGTFIMNRETYMYSGGAQDAEQIWPTMTVNGWDHEDILMMMAPKPVCVVAVTYDFFPIEGTRRTVERAQRAWDLYGKGSNLKIVEDAVTHHYSDKLATAAAEFLSEHLLGEKHSPVSSQIKAEEPCRLWCTDSGQVRGEIINAKFVYEENQDRLDCIEKQKASVNADQRTKNAREWLKSRIFKDRTACDPVTRIYSSDYYHEYLVEFGIWWSQPGIMNHGFLFRRIDMAGQKLPVTVAVWDDGTNSLDRHADFIRQTTEQGRSVLVLDTTGVGAVEPYPLNAVPVHEFYGAIHKFNDDLMWIDDSIAALRTYDVIRCLDAISQWPNLDASDVELYGHGKHSVYAQLALALEDRYKGIDLEEAFTSYADWVRSRHYDDYDIRSIILPGILKYTDLSELLGE